MRSRLVDTARFDNLKLVKQAFYNSKVVERGQTHKSNAHTAGRIGLRPRHIRLDETPDGDGHACSQATRCSAVIVDD